MNITINRYALTRADKIAILNGSCLSDTHVDLFHSILRSHSEFEPRSTLIVQHIVKNPQSSRLRCIDRNVRHLQLSHSCDDLCKDCVNGHWICCYYDTAAIFIYDSLNSRRLHVNNELFLKKLFPYFNEIPKYFKTVQNQNNGRDCGVLAMAFATSIVFQQNPSQITYDLEKIRPHLYDMFERNTLIHFPTTKNLNLNNNLLLTSTVFHKSKNPVSILKTSVGDVKSITQNNDVTVVDTNSFVASNVCTVQTNNPKEISSFWNVTGLPNPDIQCYANSCLQVLLHCTSIRQEMFENREQNALYFALQKYVSGQHVNIMELRAFADNQYIEKRQQDVAEFITHLCSKSDNFTVF